MAYITSPNTGDSVAAQAPNAVRKIWQSGVDIFEQSEDFFRPFEGRSRTSLIQSKVETSKGRGQEIEFVTMAGLHGEPHIGDELFEDGDDFEPINLDSNSLVVDYLRHAVRYTERMEEKLGMRGEIAVGLPEELGKWLGRQKTEKLFMMLLHRGTSDNTKYAGGRGGVDALTNVDTIDYDEIITLVPQLKRLGGMPAYVGRDMAGNTISKYCIIATTDALFSLEMDPTFKQKVIDGDSRGAGNYIFKGGYHNLRGQIIKEYCPIDHDGWGAIGSPANPKAELGTAVTAGTATFFITGGGTAEAAALTSVYYYKWFPKFNYRFLPGDSLDTSGDPSFYVAIVNPDDGSANANKFGFYKCNANNGNKLTVEARLGSAPGGIRATTVGNVTWNSAVNTDAHPIGSSVFLCNANGVIRGRSFALAQRAARRGYGKWRNRRTEDVKEGGFVRDIFITSVFGQEPRLDVRGRAPGYRVLEHALQVAGTPLNPTLA